MAVPSTDAFCSKIGAKSFGNGSQDIIKYKERPISFISHRNIRLKTNSNNSTTHTCGVLSVGRHDEFPKSIARECSEMDKGTENPNLDSPFPRYLKRKGNRETLVPERGYGKYTSNMAAKETVPQSDLLLCATLS